MLQIDKVQEIEGVTVFGDDTWPFNTFYLLPQQPRFRRDENESPVFKFIKYRLPVDRPDGKKGGGFVIFDAEFVVPEDRLPKIKEVLQSQVNDFANGARIPIPEVKIGTITYTSGETLLGIAGADGLFVQKIFNPGVPSLYGANITTFNAELTPDGATFFEQALQGKGGAVSVVYKLKFWAKLPPMKVFAQFNSTQFYSFYQKVDIDWELWADDSYRETVREQMIDSQSIVVDVDPGGITDEKLKNQVREWALHTIEDFVEKKMIESIAPVPDDQRKVPDGIEHVTRDISKTKVTTFTIRYQERATVEWSVNPQGTLPNITNLTGKDGKPLKWADFAVVVDLDDPFFKELRVDTFVNADFERLPIHSVEVKVLYKEKPMPNLAPDAPEGEVVLRKPDDVGHFATFVEGNDWKYKYSYQVNYKGVSQQFQSEVVETDEGDLTIGVDDVGILSVDVAAGDLNWEQVQSAQVKLTYEDSQESVGPIEDQFTLTKEKPSHLFQQVIFKPFRKSYQYHVKYFMKDGKEFDGGVNEGRAKNLFINDPFGGTRTIKVIAAGDLQNKIQNIFVDLTYTDDQNTYTQKRSISLSKDSVFIDWSFPVISDTLGKISYSGNVLLKDGTVHPITPDTTNSNTIIVPKAPLSTLEVTVVPDLLDFSTYKLVKLSLLYNDDANFASLQKDYIFSAAKKNADPFKISIFDAAKKQYTWQATFFMNTNSETKVGPNQTDSPTVVLESPA